MKKICLLLLCLVLFAFRNNDYVLLKSISGEFSFVTTDAVGNIYTVEGNTIAKYDNDGNLLKTFCDKTYGTITSIDVSDPFKILLNYAEFRRILFLDNMLSPTGDAITIESLGFDQADLACSSYQNGFWIYNQQNHELVRFDQNLILTNQSGNIWQVTGDPIEVFSIIESSNYLVVSDTARGLYLFDKYGTFYKHIPYTGIEFVQVMGDNLLFIQNENLINYNFKSFEENSISLPEKGCINARFINNRLLLQLSEGINIYTSK